MEGLVPLASEPSGAMEPEAELEEFQAGGGGRSLRLSMREKRSLHVGVLRVVFFFFFGGGSAHFWQRSLMPCQKLERTMLWFTLLLCKGIYYYWTHVCSGT